MSSQEPDITSIPWPEWMLRYIASDDEEAFDDLIWSVGGSPPYGGVSYDEAEAVYNLLEAYRGPGMADASAYQDVIQYIRGDPYRLAVLRLFHTNDQITSDPDSYTGDMVGDGMTLADQLNHDGARAVFLAYLAQLFYRLGDPAEALKYNLDALTRFLQLADIDPVYAKRAAQTAQNTVAFTAETGDLEGARQLQEKLRPIIEGFDLQM